MANYAGADPGIAARLAFWKRAFGARHAADVSPDDVADALAELALSRGRTFLGRDKASGEQRFKARRHAALAPATVNRYLTSLGSVYRWARRRRLLPRGFIAPTRGIDRPSVDNGRVRYFDEPSVHACSPPAASRLVAALPARPMAITTGARKGELLALTWRDLDLERAPGLRPHEQERRAARALLVAPVLAEIERIRSRRPKTSSSRATSARAGHAHRPRFRDACTAARIEDFRFHDLRHSCASYRRRRRESSSKSPTRSATSSSHGEALRAPLDQSKRRLVDRVLGEIR